jgi:putative transposase
VYRSLKETLPNTIARRPGPVAHARTRNWQSMSAASRLHGEGYRKLWARLRFAGVRTISRRGVMRENGLLAPHRVGRTETKLHDGRIITDKVNEMRGTDMTQTIREGRANVFVAVEHANSEVVGIHASRSANCFEG